MNRPTIEKRSVPSLLAGLLVVAGAFTLSQASEQKRTLIINGQSTQVPMIEVNGHSYVGLEALVDASNGSLSYSGNTVALRVPIGSTSATRSEAPSQETPSNPGLSRELLKAGIEQRSTLREWHTVLATALLSPVLLSALSGSGSASEAGDEWSLGSLQEGPNQTAIKSEPQRPADAQVKTVLDKMAAAGVARPASVADVRKAYLFYPTLSGSPEHVFRIEDRQIPGAAGNIPVRVYTPRSTSGLPVLVFFHGGGFVAGSLDSHDTPLRSVANRCECIVVSVAYRLAPENRYPAAPEDAYAATKWVADHGSEIGGDPSRIAVGGDGAGGNLAAVVTLMARERGNPRLIFQVLIYPVLDASTMRPSWWKESNVPTVSRETKNAILAVYLPVAGNLRDPLVAPLLAENLKNLPPALIITYEGTAMRDEGQDYANRLVQDGVAVKVSTYSEVIHGFFLMAGDLDAGKKCIDETASALRTAFKVVSQSPSQKPLSPSTATF